MAQALVLAALLVTLYNAMSVSAADVEAVKREVRFELSEEQARAIVEPQEPPISLQRAQGGRQGQQQLAQREQMAPDYQDIPQLVEEVLESARRAIEQRSIKDAQRALEHAHSSIQRVIEQASEEVRQQLEQIAQKISQAQQAISNEDIPAARQALEETQEALQQLARAGGQQQAKELGQQQEQATQAQLAEQEELAAMPASDLIGAAVNNEEGENVAEIVDLVRQPSSGKAYAVLSIGGFLGIGEKRVLLPLDELQVGPDGEIVLPNISEDQLRDMPEYNEEAYEIADEITDPGLGVAPAEQQAEAGDQQQAGGQETAAQDTTDMPMTEHQQQVIESQPAQGQRQTAAEGAADMPATEHQQEAFAEVDEPAPEEAAAEEFDMPVTEHQQEVLESEPAQEQAQQAQAAPSEPPQPELQRAYWNTWFERGREVVTELKTGLPYSFVLDLAPFNYGELKRGQALSVEAAPSLQDWLRNLHDQEEVTLTIRPVLLGNNLRFFGNTVEHRDITIRLDRLGLKPDEDVLEQYGRGALPLPEFADAVQAGSIEFMVQAVERGCGIVALSIWHGLTPLDHLVRAIAVGDETGTPTTCGGETEISGALRGGFASLLSPALDLGPNPSTPPDAALHIFELQDGSRTRSVAVFVDGSDPSSLDGGEKPEPEVFIWEMQTLLSGYLATGGSGANRLVVKLNEARAWASKGVKDAYQEVAQELKIKIFSATSEAGQQQASHALRALQALAARSSPAPIVIARVAAASSENLYIPLGLLAAEGINPVLENPITVVQPLPKERYPRDMTCIDTWAFGVPTELSGAQDDAIALGDSLSELIKSTHPWLRTPWPNDLDSLRDYLGSLESTGARHGEGFLLLAHHDGGVLWFKEAAQRVLLEEIKRRFPMGSVAVLAACSTSAPESDNRLILERLNANGVDAMVVSPLPIRVDFGARLAIEFAGVIRNAEARDHDPTLAELFEAAHKRTADHFRGQGSEFDEMALEFVILGDYGLRLCSSTPSN